MWIARVLKINDQGCIVHVLYITKLDFTEIRENALGILRQNSFALIWHVCAAPHRFQILTMHRSLRIHSRYCLIDALLAMDICQHTHGPWTPCAFNLLMPPKHMSWDHMIKSCAQLHLSDPQGEFWWIWAYPNCKHPQCSGHSLQQKTSWLKANCMVILQTEPTHSFNFWRFHSSFMMLSSILAINRNGSTGWKDGRCRSYQLISP